FDPATEEPLAEIAGASAGQVDAAADAAAAAFGPWSGLTADQRGDHLDAFADALEERRAQLVETIVADVGTPVALCEALQVAAPLIHRRNYARLARLDRTEALGPHLSPVASDSLVSYRPVGPVAAIVAYNYPFSLAVIKVGAALAAGCTVVMLPSPQAPLTSLIIAEAALEAGLPAGVLNVILGGAEVSRRLIDHPAIRRVSFTGSVEVGRAVMERAARRLTGSILELGGKSAAIVAPGVDLARIVEPLHLRYARNAGQGCQSPTRLLVHEDDLAEFEKLSVDAYARIAVGDPGDASTVVGPLISAAHRDRVEGFVTEALAEGGRTIAGGGRPAGLERGWYVNPALVGGVSPDSRIAREEIFGPVAVVLPYRDLDEAVRIANDSELGLAAYVFAASLAEAFAIGEQLEAGSVYINGGGGFREDAPMGGVKNSGLGREIGEWGVREYLEPCHVQWALT
ncbi:MAG TPA: aldehyde dehydrogenase family protein, partial [Solirubrobacterales bacterium]|nr:aldehyde dehydrogenase family protein [Solirubrobacterales bacterium]